MWSARHPISSLVRSAARLVGEDRPTSAVALAFVVSQLPTLTWDLPGSHGWENDGIAPRDLFACLAFNLTPGHAHQYPLLHSLLLVVLSLPVLLPALLSGPLSAEAIRERVLSVPCMTGISLIAKGVAIAMAALALLVLARIVRRTFGARAARFAAAFAATNLTFAFYGRVSNLDVPCLTYVVFALDAVLDVLELGDARAFRRVALFAAAAVATKDQAYASFVLVLPLYLVVVPLLGRRRGERFPSRELARAAGLGALGYGLLSGALLNPTGYLVRLRMLTGGNSQAWRGYARDLGGVLANVRDALVAEPSLYWPFPALGIAWLGVVVAALARPGEPPLGGRAARLLPFVAALSSFAFFTLPVARSEARFLLPLGLFLSAYGGVAADALLGLSARGPSLALPLVRAALVVSLAWAGVKSFAVHLTQLDDGRRAVRAWLSTLPPGSSVETYGLTVYAPHFDVSERSPYHVTRVGPDPPRSRNPLVGVREIKAPIADATGRRPDVLVISEGFANAYLVEPAGHGQTLSRVVEERRADRDTGHFVRLATSNELPGYHIALVARPSLPAWAHALGLDPVRLHSTTGIVTWILVRDGSPAASRR